MKSNVKFFTGLTLGLVLGILFFNTFELQSKSIPNSAMAETETAMEQDDSIKGEWITHETANTLIASYERDFRDANNLPQNTTTGGWVGKKHLRDICGLTSNADEYIKFKFYQTTDSKGDPQIGIIFYPSQTSSLMLKTGSSSFCPTICEYPGQ